MCCVWPADSATKGFSLLANKNGLCLVRAEEVGCWEAQYFGEIGETVVGSCQLVSQ